jgi:AraC-like DNA-binding protein
MGRTAFFPARCLTGFVAAGAEALIYTCMKPRLEKLTLAPKYSFILQHDVCAYYPTPWHYHPEFELVLVVSSTGQRTVGDHTEKFADGDLVFLGPNLPHAYQNDPAYYQGDPALQAEAIVIQFREEFLGPGFFRLPEMTAVSQLFDKARFGLKLLGSTRRQVAALMQHMLFLNGYQRITHLLQILEILSVSEEYQLLVSPGFVQQYAAAGTDPITKAHEYIVTNFRQDISLADAAGVANLSVPTFCRSFKACTRKSFSHFLNEVRVGYACKLLLEDKYNITRICYESGFNNMSNFNRQFKKITGIPPLQYRKRRKAPIPAAAALPA